MAQYQSSLNRVPANRTRVALRQIFTKFLNDDDPTTFKAVTFGAATTPISLTGAFTTGISIAADGTTAIAVTSAFTGVTGFSFAGTASGDGILISGACADGVHISGTNTASGLHISGDQVVSALIDVDAAVTAAVQVKVDDGITATYGLDISRSGTTGICTTGIRIDTDGTTGIDITSGFTGVTGITIAGTASGDGILVSGACADGIHISGTNTASGLHISGDQVQSVLIDVDAAVTDAIYIGVDDGITATVGLNIDRTGTTGICTTGIRLDVDGTTGIDITSGFTGVTGITIAGTASGDGILVSGACADGIHISGTNTATGLHISGDQVLGILVDVDAAVTAALQIGVDDGITADYGIDIVRTGTTGICTTGIRIDTDGTTGIEISAGFTGTTMLRMSGTATDGIAVLGACGDGIHVSGTNTVTALHVSGTQVIGLQFEGTYSDSAITIGTSGTPISLAAQPDHAIDIYTTSPSTDAGNSVRPIHMTSTMAGIGGVGGRAEFEMTSNVALGGWANALKGYFNMGASCTVSGLGSAVVAELLLPGASLGGVGSYGVLEMELVTQASGLTGGAPVAFQWMQVSGDGTATADFEDNGYIAIIKGLTEGTGNIFSAGADVVAAATLRILVGTTPYYILLGAGEST